VRVSVSILLLLLAGILVMPGSAFAAGLPNAGSSGPCQLTTQPHAGQDIVVSGTAFAPGTDVEITQTWGGSSATLGSAGTGGTTTQTVQSDASGAFELTVPAGPGHGGQYTFSATAGGCTATAEVVAIETAGGLHGDGTTEPTQPPTDTAPAAVVSDPLIPLLLIAAALLGLLLTGLAAARRRSRPA
jgi:hypothetical protein